MNINILIYVQWFWSHFERNSPRTKRHCILVTHSKICISMEIISFDHKSEYRENDPTARERQVTNTAEDDSPVLAQDRSIDNSKSQIHPNLHFNPCFPHPSSATAAHRIIGLSLLWLPSLVIHMLMVQARVFIAVKNHHDKNKLGRKGLYLL